jgi:hypothetical protein
VSGGGGRGSSGGGGGGGRGGSQTWVHAEQLLWVLEPSKLYPLLFGGVTFDEEKVRRLQKEELSVNKSAGFVEQRMLAEHYEAQIDMLAETCLDRSYNCIHMLEQDFSYEMLISCMANERLPVRIRASFVTLLLRLYIDRFPHRHLPLPDFVRVLDDTHAVSLTDNNALPQFDYQGASKVDKYSTANKFHLVEDFVSDYFIAAKGCQIYSDRQRNIFTLNLLQVVAALTSFGFYGTHEELTDILDPLVAILDGRGDSRRAAEGGWSKSTRHDFEALLSKIEVSVSAEDKEDDAIVKSTAEGVEMGGGMATGVTWGEGEDQTSEDDEDDEAQPGWR